MVARVLAIVVSVCVSVCLTPVCVKTAKCRITQTMPRDIPGTLVFWCQQSLLGDPHSPWNLRSKWPTFFLTPQFRPISAIAPQPWELAKKSSISTNRKLTTRFPTSHRWTVYVTHNSPKGWQKRDFAVFASEIKLLSKEVCYKVSLCENFRWQSCSYIIPLSNGP